jgi:hypothetical protein
VDANASQGNALTPQAPDERSRFWGALSQNGLGADALETLAKVVQQNSLAPGQDVRLIGAQPSKADERGSFVDWALVASQHPRLADLDFARLFGGQEANDSWAGQAQGAGTVTLERAFRNLAERWQIANLAQTIVEESFKDSDLRNSLKTYIGFNHYGLDSLNAFRGSSEFEVVAKDLIVERLLKGSSIDLPSVIKKLHDELGKIAAQRLERDSQNGETSETWLSVLEDFVTSQSDSVVLQRRLLLASMEFNQLEQQEALLKKLAEGLKDSGLIKYRSEDKFNKFRDSLLEVLRVFEIGAYLTPGTRDSPQYIVINRFRRQYADDQLLLKQEFKNAMDFVVSALAEVGYPTQWRLEHSDSEPHNGS